MRLTDAWNLFLFYKEKAIQKFVPVNLYTFFIKNKPAEILVRVDDFPHWKKPLEEFLEFDEIMKKHGIPYVLGVTPFLSKNPKNSSNKDFRRLSEKEISFLKKAQKQGRIKIAMHGVTHQTTKERPFSEFKGKPSEKIDREIKRAKEYMKKQGLETDMLIPPFNEISKENFSVLKKHFKTITGGPETIKDLGKKKAHKMDDTFYLPTYFPYYFNPRKHFIPPLKGKKILALHWPWFSRKKDIEELAKKISPYSIKYERFIKNIE